MNIPYLMVCVEKPKTPDERRDPDWPKWQTLLGESSKLLSELSSGLSKPTENLWLLPLDENLLLASKFLVLCEHSGLAYNVYRLEEAPKPCK